MTIFAYPGAVPRDPRSVVTVGTFDGVHAGHSKVIGTAVELAAERSMRPVIVTFDPHPREVLDGSPPGLLTTPAERFELFARAGAAMTVVVRFTKEFSGMSAAEFYRSVVAGSIGLSEAVVGYDHMFGHHREAGVIELTDLGKTMGFGVTVVPPVSVGTQTAGSTEIRRLIAGGMVEEAAAFLGRSYSADGEVVRGDGRGASIGFPTANISVPSAAKLLPGRGVYLARVDVRGRRFNAMVNIGTRPTFGEGGASVVEAHILDFGEEIYGETVRVHFIKRIRDEKRFASAAELTAQLKQDRAECLKEFDSVDQS